MRSILPKLSVLILVLMCNIVLSGTEFPRPGTRIITSEEIQNSGITRIGDILQLIDEWHLCSTDGYTWQISANNLSSFQGQNWVVMLDGHKFDLNYFDVNNINFLPVTLDQIDFVEVVDIPRLHEGEFSEQGLIHFHTKQAGKGLAINIYQMAGNITGETGPYKHTDLQTPDLQRIGRDAAYTFNYGFENWYLQTYMIRHYHPFVDLAMIRRNNKILEVAGGYSEPENGHIKLWFEETDRPKMLRNSLSLRAGRRDDKEFDLQMDYSYSEKYFLFFRPAGREIPVNDFYARLAFKGNIFDNFHYKFQYHVKQIMKFPNAIDWDFDWKTHRLGCNLERDFRANIFQARIGIGYDRFILETNYELDEDYVDLANIYGEISCNLFENMYQEVGGFLRFSNGEVALKGSLINSWKINSRQCINAGLSYSGRLPEEDNNLWIWTQKGYDLLHDNDIEYIISDDLNKSSQFTGDVNWKFEPDDNFTISLAGSYRVFKDLCLEKQNFQFNSQDYSFSSPSLVYGDRQGQVTGGHVDITCKLLPVLTQQFFYSWQTDVRGDDVFREIWQTIPHHKAVFKITYAPAMNFSLWAKLSYLSSTTWNEYEDIDGQVYYSSDILTQKYHNTIGSSTIVDLQFQKWLWQKRMLVSLLLRNVGNSDFRYHPVGASFDMTYYLQFKLILDF